MNYMSEFSVGPAFCQRPTPGILDSNHKLHLNIVLKRHAVLSSKCIYFRYHDLCIHIIYVNYLLHVSVIIKYATFTVGCTAHPVHCNPLLVPLLTGTM
jgi:hypothetical protein